MSKKNGQRRPHPHADIMYGLYKRQGPWSPLAGFFGPTETNAPRERRALIHASKQAKKKRSWVRTGRKHGWL